MNVYDFDKTIYAGDSTVDFYLYCLKKQPKLIKALPEQISGFVLYKLKRITKTQLKERFFSFLKYMSNREILVHEFWQANQHKICPWYLREKKEDDVIISASPEFLLQEMTAKLSAGCLIASEVDLFTGKFYSENCYGSEKRNRFLQKFPDHNIEKFFSDSISDAPMAAMARKAYLVNGPQIMEWDDNKRPVDSCPSP